MDQKKAIAKSIRSKTLDINAEVLLADLIERGFGYEDFLINHDGLFKRNFSKDILDAYFDVVKNILVLKISRDSLYDILPHGLFHHMIKDFKPENRSKKFEQLKREEAHARKFFLPFDNEFFNQFVELELELRSYFKNPGKFLQNLLLFNRHLPPRYALKLTTYILFADEIIGNIKLTAFILANLIDEEVAYRERFEWENIIDIDINKTVFNYGYDETTLGFDYVIGHNVKEEKKIWEFTIELKKDDSIKNYINNDKGTMLEIIECFYEYFIPFEIEVKTKISCSQLSIFRIGSASEIDSDILQKDIEKIHLGYNTTL